MVERDEGMKIWKFGFDLEDEVIIKMPRGAKVLHVDMQHDGPKMWALCHTVAPIEERTFFVVGTGHPMPVHADRHVGTFMMEPMFVWHVFEKAG